MSKGMTIPLYFFLNGKLHKKIKEIKSQDWIICFCFPDEKRYQYDGNYVRKQYQMAYKTKDLAALLRVNVEYLKLLMRRKMVNLPSGQAYGITTYKLSFRFWSEDDVLKLRDRLYDLAPKDKYGMPFNNLKLISKAELEAEFSKESYYVQNNKGEMIKVWRAF